MGAACVGAISGSDLLRELPQMGPIRAPPGRNRGLGAETEDPAGRIGGSRFFCTTPMRVGQNVGPRRTRTRGQGAFTASKRATPSLGREPTNLVREGPGEGVQTRLHGRGQLLPKRELGAADPNEAAPWHRPAQFRGERQHLVRRQ